VQEPGYAQGVEQRFGNYGDLPRYQAATRRMHNRAAAEVPQALAQILRHAQARAECAGRWVA
ncbi:MAG: hypothetical protein ACN6N5_03595, partial [Diaphorobacter nitroreducens]